MTKEQYEQIKQYEDIINDAVLEGIIEMLIDWMKECDPSKFSKEQIVSDALKGFKEQREIFRDVFQIDLDKIGLSS